MRRGDFVILRHAEGAQSSARREAKRHASRAMKGPRGELELLASRRRAHQRLTRRVELARFAHPHIFALRRCAAVTNLYVITRAGGTNAAS